jgi:hypothetical protein
VKIRRRLAVDNPAAFEPGLARSLAVLSFILAARGDSLRALSATGEAVELYRPRVGTLPSAFQQLHNTLHLQAQLLEDVGRQKEAASIWHWLRVNPLPSD